MKYHLITMGCPKNKVDSDGMEMLLQQADLRATVNPGRADVLIVNTCGFLEAAKEESIGVLQELAGMKKRGQMLIAAGCLAQRNGDEVLARVPGIDGLLGTRRWREVLELLRGLRADGNGRGFARYSLLGDPEHDLDGAVPRPPVAGGSAYLKISDGCNAPCAFCTIPSFKGKLRSRPLEAVVNEAIGLVGAGAKELVIVAQDTTDYGRDWGEPDSLARLLAAVCNRTDDALRWVRLMYAYPGHVSDALIEVMATQPKIVPYLDMPLQHGDPRTLKRMRRPSRLEMVYDHMSKLRAAMPDIALRTTFIVGYPGETDEEFETLLDWMDEAQLDRVGCFQYENVDGARSNDLPDHVPAEVKQDRWERFMEKAQAISEAKLAAKVGQRMEVIVDLVEEDGATCRTKADAPEIDGNLFIDEGFDALQPGQLATVEVDEASA